MRRRRRRRRWWLHVGATSASAAVVQRICVVPFLGFAPVGIGFKVPTGPFFCARIQIILGRWLVLRPPNNRDVTALQIQNVVTRRQGRRRGRRRQWRRRWRIGRKRWKRRRRLRVIAAAAYATHSRWQSRPVVWSVPPVPCAAGGGVFFKPTTILCNDRRVQALVYQTKIVVGRLEVVARRRRHWRRGWRACWWRRGRRQHWWGRR